MFANCYFLWQELMLMIVTFLRRVLQVRERGRGGERQ